MKAFVAISFMETWVCSTGVKPRLAQEFAKKARPNDKGQQPRLLPVKQQEAMVGCNLKLFALG